MAKARFVLFAWALAMVMVAQPATAAALTSVVDDPVGDAGFTSGITAQPYQDIVRAEITKSDGVFWISMEFAADIPNHPALPAGVALFMWGLGINADESTFPAGFPFPPGSPEGGEFHVDVIWDGTRFSGFVIDRRPLLTGGDAQITPVPFKVSQDTITVRVEASILGDPTAFGWFVKFIFDWYGPLGSGGWLPMDFAGPGVWPS